jgi:Na+/proline symporter
MTLILYLAIQIIICIYISKKTNTESVYYSGGRNFSTRNISSKIWSPKYATPSDFYAYRYGHRVEKLTVWILDIVSLFGLSSSIINIVKKHENFFLKENTL